MPLESRVAKIEHRLRVLEELYRDYLGMHLEENIKDGKD